MRVNGKFERNAGVDLGLTRRNSRKSARKTDGRHVVGDLWHFATVAPDRHPASVDLVLLLRSLVTCLGLFLVPTIFAGMVSPYAIRIIVKNKESSGHDAGYLYFVSTLGSSLGTLLTAFYLVLLFEVNTILMAAISISVILGGLGALTNYQRE